MKKFGGETELSDHWSLTSKEHDIIATHSGKNRLGLTASEADLTARFYEVYAKWHLMTAIAPLPHKQRNLFTKETSDGELMKVIDAINAKWGHYTVQYASAGFKKDWSFKREQLSQAYTTKWDQLPVVKASFQTGIR